jgi:hypothetical protein
LALRLTKEAVIPGCASWRRPGIHNPCTLGLCEAASQLNITTGVMDSGLALRAPRNDEERITGDRIRLIRRHTFAISPHGFVRGFPNRLRLLKQRAQGRPGARCTRGLVCIDAQRNAHTSIQVQRKHSGLPCAMALRLIRALPGESELLATIALERRWPLKDLTPAIRASGPHDFAVRECSIRRAFAPEALAATAACPNVRDVRETPLLRDRMGPISR